jgi:hypothetical protein
MLRNFKITYRALFGQRTIKIEAYSKYNAKKRFYVMNPKAEIIKIVRNRVEITKTDVRLITIIIKTDLSLIRLKALKTN